MRDSELAASIVAGEPEGLAKVYEKYGDLLWSYCRSLLPEEGNAAEAVADTFVIAASKLGVLPTLGRLRAWLYAVARIECRRRMRSARPKAAPSDGERLRRTVKELSTGELRQLHALLYAAFAGLDEAERDVMQLVWHGLDLAEVAAVLGVTRANAHALFGRARDQLEVSVGVVLMGWSWRGGCDAFEDMHDGKQLTPDIRARLGRHIARCGVCQERYKEQLRPTLLPFLSTRGLLTEAADARSEIAPAPVGLWEQVYQMTSQQNAKDRWNKILGRRIAFGADGFPKQLAESGMLARTSFKVAAVGTVAVATGAAAWATHGHPAAQVSARDIASGPRTAVVGAPVMVSNGAHAGAPSDKIHSTHQPAHAKPANTAPSATVPSTTAPPASSPSSATSRTESAASSPTAAATPSASAKASTPAASPAATTPSASASPSASGSGNGSGGGSSSDGSGGGGSTSSNGSGASSDNGGSGSGGSTSGTGSSDGSGSGSGSGGGSGSSGLNVGVPGVASVGVGSGGISLGLL